MQEMGVRSLHLKGSWEYDMATHFDILAGRIPWAEEPGGLQSMGSQESDMSMSMYTVQGVWGPYLSATTCPSCPRLYKESIGKKGSVSHQLRALQFGCRSGQPEEEREWSHQHHSLPQSSAGDSKKIPHKDGGFLKGEDSVLIPAGASSQPPGLLISP